MRKKKSGRGIVLSRDALQKARKIKHNMTQEDLAAALRIDVREIQRAEAEEPIDPDYAHRLSGILGRELSELVKKDGPPQTEPPPKQEDSWRADAPNNETVSHALEKLFSAIVFDGTYKPPVKEVALKKLSDLALFLGMQDGYDENNVHVEIGSLIISVPLSRRDASKLLNAFIAGNLERFKVVSVTVAEKATGKNVQEQVDTISDQLASVLSPKDMQVFNLIVEGASTRTIADRLQVSTRTVEIRRLKIKEALTKKIDAGSLVE